MNFRLCDYQRRREETFVAGSGILADSRSRAGNQPLLTHLCLQTRSHFLLSREVLFGGAVLYELDRRQKSLPGSDIARMGMFAEGIAAYEEALRLKPNYPEAHNNLGTTYAVTGRPVEAMACYQQALWLNPEYPEVR